MLFFPNKRVNEAKGISFKLSMTDTISTLNDHIYHVDLWNQVKTSNYYDIFVWLINAPTKQQFITILRFININPDIVAFWADWGRLNCQKHVCENSVLNKNQVSCWAGGGEGVVEKRTSIKNRIFGG